MRLRSLLFVALVLLYASCKKDSVENDSVENNSVEPSLTGRWGWTIPCTDNPTYNTTQQSKGIMELLAFDGNGSYTVTQSGTVTDSGTYRTSIAKNMSGESVPSVLYTNSRVSDSAAYYNVTESGDTLSLSTDFIGAVGSETRYYSRQ